MQVSLEPVMTDVIWKRDTVFWHIKMFQKYICHCETETFANFMEVQFLDKTGSKGMEQKM